MSTNLFILASQQSAWRLESLIEDEPSAGNNSTLVLNNSSGASVSLTGLEIIGQQKGATHDVLNRGTDPIVLLADNAEVIEAFQFADDATIAADASIRLYYDGFRWQVLAQTGGEVDTGTPTKFPVYGIAGTPTDSLLENRAGDRLHWGGTSFSLWNPTFVNFQNADAMIRIGDTTSQFVNVANHNYFIDIEPAVNMTVDGIRSVGVFCRIQAKTDPGIDATATGLHGNAYSWGNGSNGGLTMYGVRGECYVRSMNEVGAYGGRFDCYTGGNGAGTNTTPLWGIWAQADGGHNGITPQVRSAEFRLSTVGGGGVGSITDGRVLQLTVDGSQPITDFDQIRGLSISDWINVAGGRTWNTSYGIYIDASIDRGTTKYALYSLSTSDSLFSGPMKWAIANESVSNGALRLEFAGFNGANYTVGLKLRATHGMAYHPLHLVTENAAYGTTGTMRTASVDGFTFQGTPGAGSPAQFTFGNASLDVGIFATDAASPALNVMPSGATQVGLRIGLRAAQSADALKINTSGGDNVFNLTPAGLVTIGNANNTANGALSMYYGGTQWCLFDRTNTRVLIDDATYFGWMNFGGSVSDLGMRRAAASVLEIVNHGWSPTGGGALMLGEMAAAPAATANKGTIYTEDNGAGKTRLMVKFGTGAAVQIAIEP